MKTLEVVVRYDILNDGRKNIGPYNRTIQDNSTVIMKSMAINRRAIINCIDVAIDNITLDNISSMLPEDSKLSYDINSIIVNIKENM